MDLDENVQKTIQLLLRRWKIIVAFAIIGCLLAYAYTSHFVTPTYSSSVEFLAYAVDVDNEMAEAAASSSSSSSGDAVRTSNTSKMNYAMKMLTTYIEIFQTTSFYDDVSTELTKNYGINMSSIALKNCVSIESIEDTAMFTMTVTTTDAENSYKIAMQLKKSVPDRMKKTNSGLVEASVEDSPIRPNSAVSLGYPKKCLIGAVAGIVLAAVYIILRDLLDVRIKGEDDLVRNYDIPILGTIPDFGKSAKKHSQGAK